MANDASAPHDPHHAVLEAIAAIAPETNLAQVRADQPLRQQVDLDSMDWLNLIAGIEDRLGVSIPQEQAGQLKTIDAIVACVASRPTAPPKATAVAAPSPLPTVQHLVDGRAVTVRPIGPADLDLEAEFVRGLSPEARYKRFMTAVAELPRSKLRYLTEIDQLNHVALVAVFDRDGRPDPVGVVRYVVEPDSQRCEFAIAVDDDFQRTGLAGLLMRQLIDIARARGLTTMEGLVLATNAPMLRFTRQLGFRQQHEPDDYSTVRVTLDL